jgi:hypothetical protein
LGRGIRKSWRRLVSEGSARLSVDPWGSITVDQSYVLLFCRGDNSASDVVNRQNCIPPDKTVDVGAISTHWCPMLAHDSFTKSKI